MQPENIHKTLLTTVCCHSQSQNANFIFFLFEASRFIVCFVFCGVNYWFYTEKQCSM